MAQTHIFKILNFLEEKNLGANLLDLGFVNEFLDIISKTKQNKKGKLNFTKITSAKDTVKRMEIKSIDWKRISANYIKDLYLKHTDNS